MKETKKHYYIFPSKRLIREFSGDRFLKHFLTPRKIIISRDFKQVGYFIELAAEWYDRSETFYVVLHISASDVLAIASSPDEKQDLGFLIGKQTVG
jgi:hypothetical protein